MITYTRGYLKMHTLTLEEFEDINYDDLNYIFSTTGRDIEMDFNIEDDIEFIYGHPETYKRDYPQLQYYKVITCKYTEFSTCKGYNNFKSY